MPSSLASLEAHAADELGAEDAAAALGDVNEALRRRADAARAADASDDDAALRRGVVEEYRAERALLWAMVAHALREHSSRLAVPPR